jgi:predicted GNAT family acetyltransferase
MNVRHDDESSRGRFVLLDQDRAIGELTWKRQGPGRVVADHTWIEPASRGRGLGAILFDALVAWARTAGEKVTPSCWFVADMFEAVPASRDVRAAS